MYDHNYLSNYSTHKNFTGYKFRDVQLYNHIENYVLTRSSKINVKMWVTNRIHKKE